jgi:SAM-dependent methyltransferase
MNKFIRYFEIFKNNEMFEPSWISLFFNPFYFARKNLLGALLKHSAHLHGNMLDVGCGTQPYKRHIPFDKYVGLEYDNPRSRDAGIADIFYTGNSFPIADETFDSALCSQVLEHVFEADIFLSEINRVLKKDGVLVLTVPFVWDEHEQPHDFARYSSYGLQHLIKKAGFSVIEHEKLTNDASLLSQLTNVYLFKIVQGYPRSVRGLITLLVIAPVNIFGEICKTILPKNNDLFLDQIIVCRKK